MLREFLGLLAQEILSRSDRSENEKGQETIYYRTKDGRADYGFSIEEQNDGGLRAYITSMPSYGSRSTSLPTTHRLTDRGRHYICWDRKIEDEVDLKAVAAMWADKTQEYIKSGTTIDEQVRRGR